MTKQWGKNEFWGLGSEFDPDWLFDEEQLQLRDKLIEICRLKIRPMAIISDKTYEYPRQSLCAMAELGLLGLIVPKELGGLGQSHVCLVMIVETLARYGCPSTAMIYSMHLQATAVLLFRYHGNKKIQDLLRRLNSDVLVGTSSYSDAATGGHSWFPLSSKSQKLDEESYRIFRFNSWTTSAGFADFYVLQTPTPGVGRDHSNLTGFFVFKEEVRASTDDWSALGLHGNQSGPLIVDGVVHESRMIGSPGDGGKNNEESGAIFVLNISASWNGVALACIDVTKKHATRKTHGDVGMRVCDYPIIQDYVGRSLTETNNCRGLLYMLADRLDKITKNNDWSLHSDPDFIPRSAHSMWFLQIKHNCTENVSQVADRMLKACGGDGYKTELGLERLLRDSKAGCLMAPSNEVIRNILGKASLLGPQQLDLWGKTCNQQLLNHEIKKMDLKEKKLLLKRLSEEVKIEETSTSLKHQFQDTDFENPFSTAPPTYVKAYNTDDGVTHSPALNPIEWTPLTLASRKDVNDTMTHFVFSLPDATDHTGCLPGQYVQIRVRSSDETTHTRHFSPVSPPNQFGCLELVLKFESHGIISRYFQKLKPGSIVDFRGPCGGFEYEANHLDEITLLASGCGVTPGLQLVRSVVLNPLDATKITLIYYSENYHQILNRQELIEIAEKDPRLRLVFTLGDPPEEWNGAEGFIDQKLIEKYVTKPDGFKHKIVMCGGPTMSITCLHSLRLLDFPSDMIFIYGQFGTEFVRSVYGRNIKLSGHRCDNRILI